MNEDRRKSRDKRTGRLMPQEWKEMFFLKPGEEPGTVREQELSSY